MLHTQILKSDVERDEVLYTALIDSYVKNGRVVYARTVFDVMLEKNVVCSTSLISGYMNQGSFEDAECIFLKTLDKDVVAFNAMIEGYSKTSEYATRSLDLYIDMQRLNFWPNVSTQLVLVPCLQHLKLGNRYKVSSFAANFANSILPWSLQELSKAAHTSEIGFSGILMINSQA